MPAFVLVGVEKGRMAYQEKIRHQMMLLLSPQCACCSRSLSSTPAPAQSSTDPSDHISLAHSGLPSAYASAGGAPG